MVFSIVLPAPLFARGPRSRSTPKDAHEGVDLRDVQGINAEQGCSGKATGAGNPAGTPHHARVSLHPRAVLAIFSP